MEKVLGIIDWHHDSYWQAPYMFGSPRITQPGFIWHDLCRRVMRPALFRTDLDYLAYERVPSEAPALAGRTRPDRRADGFDRAESSSRRLPSRAIP